MNADVLTIIKNIEDRKPLATGHASDEFHVNPLESHRELYRNRNPKLNIDFSVEVLDFPGTQTFDARIVRIAAGCNNEMHKHAHESLFFIISGEAEVRIGIEAVRVNSGGVAFVPRWAFHQTSNMSQTEELVILAITDFALTKAVLGDYDKRTRLAVEGPDVVEHV